MKCDKCGGEFSPKVFEIHSRKCEIIQEKKPIKSASKDKSEKIKKKVFGRKSSNKEV